MKFAALFVSIFTLFNSLINVDSASYKILRIENCTSSDDNFLKLNECAASSSRINIAFDIPEPLNKFYVKLK